MRSVVVSVAACCSLAIVLLPAACGSKQGATFDDGDDTAGDGGSFGGRDGGIGSSGNSDGGSTCGTCSSDLHTAYDCSGHATVCPDGEGCAAGNCVAACDAASASHTSIGCEYWTLKPDVINDDNHQGDCFAVFIANTWGSPVTLTADYAGASIDIAAAARIPSGSGGAITYGALPGGQIPANDVAIVFLSSSPTAADQCPAGVTPALTTDPALHTTGVGNAFHIQTDAPVVAYQIFPYGGGNSAVTGSTLLLPSSVWTTNYLGIDAYAVQTSSTAFDAWLGIIANEDDTEIDLTPTSAITATGAIPAIAAGTTGSITLNKGQYAQLSVSTGDLTGTPIKSTKPVGVFGGNSCFNLPTGKVACDGAHQQMAPIAALGHEFVGVTYRNRYPATTEAPPWRVIGAVNGTTLTWQPSLPAGAPTTVNQGDIVEFSSAGPFVVTSQDANHPYFLEQYMTGYQDVGGTTGDARGDPELVPVVAPQQFLSSYIFFTDPTYPETNLVVVRKKGSAGFADVSLDCAGTLTGWAPVGTSGDYEFTRADLSTGNFAAVGSCNNGRHEMTSTGTFGVTIWGWGSSATGSFFSQAVSYGYPAGMSVVPINTVVVPPAPR
jgi:hypothetical protein